MKITKKQLRSIIKEELGRVINEADAQAEIEKAEKTGASNPVDTKALVDDPAEALAGVEAAKKKLLSVATMTEDAAYSKLKNLLYTPLEEFVGDKAKQEAIGHALGKLGAATLAAGMLGGGLGAFSGLLGMPAIAAGTVGVAVGVILGSVGADLERRAQIEQGKLIKPDVGHERPFRVTPAGIKKLKSR